jgi:hypothetical protein
MRENRDRARLEQGRSSLICMGEIYLRMSLDLSPVGCLVSVDCFMVATDSRIAVWQEHLSLPGNGF